MYDGQHIALVLDDEGAVVERELYGPAVDQILASESPGEGGAIRWMLSDNQGTVRDERPSGSGFQIQV